MDSLDFTHDISGVNVVTISPAMVTRRLSDFVYTYSDSDAVPQLPQFSNWQKVTNASPTASSTQTVSWSFEKWTVGTWTNTYGYEVTIQSSFTVGVPNVAQGSITIGASHTGSFANGGETGTKETTTVTHTLLIPPKSSASCRWKVSKSKLTINFTYKETILFNNGEELLRNGRGVYENIDNWNVDVEVQ